MVMFPHFNRLLISLIFVSVLPLISNAQVVINEIVASNDTMLLDEDGEYNDFIELYNKSGASINLLDYYISDDLSNPFKWQIPNVTIQGNSFLTLYASGKDRANVVDHWERLVNENSTWKYTSGTQLYYDWMEPSFNDGGWSSGAGGFGNGDGDDNTSINSSRFYLRKNFNVVDKEVIANLVFAMDFDDGFIAYLNGIEIARSGNMLLTLQNTGIVHDIQDPHEAEVYAGGDYTTYFINEKITDDVLLTGNNVLAIEVVNDGLTTGDLTARPWLFAGLEDNSQNYSTPPNWFVSPPQYLHTDFKLSRSGETVTLTNNNGIQVDQISYNFLNFNHSFGRSTDGSNSLEYFEFPTPNYTNNAATGYLGYVDEPVLTPDAGFYNGSVSVTVLNNFPGANVRYTLDGSTPTTSSAQYTGPVTISSTDVINVKAFAPGFLPSEDIANTYLINENITVNTVALQTDPPNLWDNNEGIYVLGPNASPDYPYFGANFWVNKQVRTHVEMFNKIGNALDFEQDATIKIFGGWSRAQPMKSLQYRAKSRYTFDKFDAQVWDDLNIFRVKRFIMRNSGNDFNALMFRDGLIHELIEFETNTDVGYWQPGVHFINGDYWGISNFRPQLGKYYPQEKYGYDPDEVTILEFINNTTTADGRSESREMPDGDLQYKSYMDLSNYMFNNNLAITSNYDWVKDRLDIENFVDEFSTRIYTRCTDWPQNNIKYWKPNFGGKWRYLMKDLDSGLSSPCYNMINHARDNNRGIHAQFFNELLDNAEFKTYFVNRYCDLVNTTFLPSNFKQKTDEIAALIQPEIVRHYNRWGGGDLASWQSRINSIKSFMDNRPSCTLENFRVNFNFPEQVTVCLQTNPPNAGYININTIYPQNYPWCGEYFENNPIDLTAIPNNGYQFSHWTSTYHANNNNNQDINQNVTRDDTYVAHFVQSNNSPELVISEINYNPSDGCDSGNWFEIYNDGNADLHLSNWTLTAQSSANDFTFPPGTVIAPGDYLVVVQDIIFFQSQYPNIQNVLGSFYFDLNNAGDVIELYDNLGNLHHSVTYGVTAPWPISPDGQGYTLENANYGANENQASTWTEGCLKGSPGGPFIPCNQVFPPITFSEVNYKSCPAMDAGDWVEIHNYGNSPIDVSGWTFKDSNDDNFFTIPTTTIIPAGDHLVIAQNLFLFQAQYPTVSNVIGPFGFGLAAGGDLLRLFDDNDSLVALSDFDEDPPWPTEPNGMCYTLELDDPTGNLSDYNNWFVGCVQGSPGEAFTPCILPPEPNFNSNLVAGCGSVTITFNDLSINEPDTWQWSFQGGSPSSSTSQSPTVTFSSPGTYDVTLTVTNYAGTNTITKADYVTVYSIPTVSFNNTNVSCTGGSDGVATAVPANGDAPYFIEWSDGTIATSINNLPVGVYSVNVIDDNGCSTDGITSITEPPVLGGSATSVSSTCSNNNGSATASGSGGTPPYSYSWSNGQSGATANNLVASDYTVTITDAENCTYDVLVSVEDVGSPSLSTSTVNASCNGLTNGTATVTISGGTPPFNTLWSNGQTSAMATGLAAGTHTVEITDGNNCVSVATVTITEPELLTSDLSTVSSTCGSSNGTATVTPTGGTAPYTYAWSNGQTTQTANNLLASNYSVTVTDAQNCTFVNNIDVEDIPGPIVAVSGGQISCFQANNGSASVSIDGGTAPFAYSWSNGSTIPAIGALGPGTYTVMVTDDNGCVDNASITLTEPPVLVTSFNTTPSKCNQPTGSAEILVSGGSQPYNIVWNNSDTTTSKTNIPAAVNVVVVYDNNGCIQELEVIVPPTPSPTIATQVSNVSCFGGSDAGVVVTGSGATPPYNAIWSNGYLGLNATNLTAGTYNLNMFDANGCSTLSSVTVNEPSDLIVTEASSTGTTCGQSTGAASVNVSGGQSPYQYSWSNGATSSSLSGVVAGTYNLTVTDANDCNETISVTIENIGGANLSLSNTNIDCAGGATGSATVNITGGDAPYDILWNNGQNGTTINGLVAGSYTVTVTDASDCVSSQSVIIAQPQNIEFDVTASLATCNEANGSISVNVTGGTPPYIYNWPDGSSSSSISNLAAGSYDLTVIDNNGCDYTETLTVNNAQTAVIDLLPITVTCFEGDNGSIQTTVNGGSAPFIYNWSNGETTQNLTDITAGFYNIEITDANGCIVSASTNVEEAEEITADIVFTNTTCGSANGEATVYPDGGNPPFNYSWSNGDNTQTSSNLAAGSYSVIVTDVNGCKDTFNTLIENVDGPSVALTGSDISCNGGSDGEVVSITNGGTAPYIYNWNNGQVTDVAGGLLAGSQTVTVTDANGCIATETINLTEPELLVANISATGSTCGGANGTATVNAVGGTAPYNYSWSNGATTATIQSIPAGTYSVTVTDVFNCEITENVSVENTDGAAVTIASTNVQCFGNTTGSLDISTVGGTGPFTYQWSDGQTTQQAINLSAGAYTVDVIDANGCITQSSGNVSEPQQFNSELIVVDANCGQATGSAEVNPVGGTPPYQYLWSSGQTSQIANNLVSGTYSVEIIDANQCVYTAEATVGNINGANVSVQSNASLCFGDASGTATANVSGGAAPYSYMWDNGQTSSTATAYNAGSYELVVTDANNCITVSQFNIAEPTELTASASASEALCGNANGSATVVPNGGTAPYTYLWSNGQTTETAINLLSGNYSVTVLDANNCEVTIDQAVSNAGAPVVEVSQTDVLCNGASNGTAFADVMSGVAPFTVNWSNGATTPTVSNLSPGSYSVQVIDANQCETNSTIEILEPIELSIEKNQTNSVCGSNSATATVIPSGGVPPYAFNWSNGSTGSTASDLAQGNYGVQVSDANGCIVNTTFNIIANEGPQADVTATSASCVLANNGTATLNVVGGSSPYSFLWNNGETGSVLTNLAIGSYSVVVTDDYGCTDQVFFQIENSNTVVNASAGADQLICSGEIATLQASGGVSYLWSPSTGLDANNIANPISSSNQTITYNVTVTDQNGCQAFDNVTVTVAPPVVANAGESVSICETGSITLGASGGVSYQWTPSAGLDDATSATPTATPTQTTIYTLTAYDNNGCFDTDEVNVTVSEQLEVGISGNQVICSGESVQLSASGGVNYNWSPSTGLDNPNIANPIASPLSTTTYTVNVGDGICFSSAQVTVEVAPLPISANAGANQEVCFGEAVQLQASGGDSYSWSPTAGLDNPNSINPVANLTATTTFVVQVTNNFGCIDSDEVTVVVNPLPLTNAGSDVEICFGGQTTLLASGGSSYQWMPTTGLNNPTAINPIASPNSTTTYTVTATSSEGCVQSDEVIVTVGNSLNVSTNIDETICLGDAIELVANGATNYSWSSSNGVQLSNIANQIISPTITGTYTVTGNDLEGCTGTDEVTITVNDLPNIDAGQNQSICEGEFIELVPSGGVTYSWEPLALVNPNDNTPEVSPQTTTQFTVTGTNTEGCSNTDNVTVTVNNAPSILLSDDATICTGGSVELNASGGTAYVWSPTTGLDNPLSANPTASPIVTTIYTVSVTNAEGCIGEESVTISVATELLGDAGSDQLICEGESVQLQASGGTTYSWQPTTGLSNPNIANPIASPNSSISYTVLISDGICNDEATVSVNVSDQNIVANAGSDVTICAGESFSLGVNPIAGQSYNWSPAIGLNDANSANPTGVLQSSTSYILTITNADGCSDTDNVAVTVNSLPTANAGADQSICSNETIQFLASGGSTYEWIPTTGLSNAFINNPIVNVNSSTDYTVIVTDANGCSNSDELSVNVTNAADVDLGADVTLCEGQSYQLNGPNGAINYQWTPTVGLSNPSIANPIASPTNTTTYTLNADYGNGCTSEDEIVISIGSALNISAGPDVSLCGGSEIEMALSGVPTGATILWTPATGLSNPNISNPIANPTSTTTYNIEVINGPCSGSTSITINVDEDGLSVNAGADETICSNGSVELTPSNLPTGATVSWSPTTGLSNPNIANPIASPAQTTTYTLTVNDGVCEGTDQITVEVDSEGLAVSAGADTAICNNGSVTLMPGTIPTGATVSWSPATGLSNPNIANPIASPTQTTTYTLTVNDGVCEGTDQITVEVDSEGLAISAGADTAICNDGSVTLMPGAIPAGATVSWSPTTGLSNPNIANPIASPSQTTTYTLTVNNGVCEGTDQITVEVDEEGLAVSAGADETVCNGGNVTLMPGAIPTGATVSWSPTTGLSNPNIANPIANPTQTTTYTLTVNNGVCSGTDQITVEVDDQDLMISAGQNLMICDGASVMLNPTGVPSGATVSWSPSTGLDNTSILNPTAMPTVTTIYTLNVSNGACSGSAQVTVEVGDGNINFSAGSDVEVCAGEVVGIGTTGQAGLTYLWSPDVGLNNPNIAQPEFTSSVSTIYTLTVTNEDGCSDSDQVFITVNELPNADAGNDITICDGTAAQLNSFGGQSYSWTPSNSLSNSNISNPTANPLVTTTYTVTVTDNNGCTDSDEVAVNVAENIDFDLGNDVTICNGLEYQLNGPSGFDNYQWSPSTGLNNPNIANPIATVNEAVSYTLTVSTNSGCFSSDNINLFAAENLSIQAGNDIVACDNEGVQLFASGVPVGASVVWSPSTGLSNATIPNPIATVNNNLTYTVTVTDASGCFGEDEISIEVGSIPNVSISENVTICNGDNTSLIATGGVSYLWSPSIGLNNNTINNPTVNISATTTYTVEVANAEGCTTTETVTVFVEDAPTIQTSEDVVVCNGESTTLSASGAATYQWSPIEGLNNPNDGVTIANPIETTVYTVQAFSENGCVTSNSVTITVPEELIADAGEDITLCTGGSTSLNATGGASYSWLPVTGLSNPNIFNPIASPNQSTIYTVLVSDEFGCTSTDIITVNVGAEINVSAGDNIQLCNGESGQLQASGGTSYIWTPSIGLNDPSISNPTVSINETTTYMVEVSDGICNGTAEVTVTVSDENVVAFAGGDFSACSGEIFTLGEAAQAGYQYSWSPQQGLSNPNISNPDFEASQSGSYTLTVVDANGCSAIDEINIDVNESPVANAGADFSVCEGESIQLQATGGTAYTWSPNAGLSDANSSNPTATIFATTTYTVEVTNANNCTAYDEVTITVNAIEQQVDLGLDIGLCEQEAVQLNGETDGAVDYQWLPTTGLNNPNIANPIADVSSDITYTLNVTFNNGCVSSDEISIAVGSGLAVQTSSDIAICEGESTQLEANGGDIYLWSPTTGLSDPNISNPVASPSVSTVYSVTVIDSDSNCSGTQTIVVDVVGVEDLVAGPDVEICEGESIQLFAQGGVDYLWSPAASLDDFESPNPVASPTETTTYTVIIGNGSCNNIDEVTVSVNEANFNVEGDSEICNGESTTLIATGGSSYFWQPFDFFEDANAAEQTVQVEETTTFIVTIDNGFCSEEIFYTVEVSSGFSDLQVSQDQAICLGGEAQLSVMGSEVASVLWVPSIGLNDPTIANPIANPTETTTYTAIVISNEGCQQNVEVTVSIGNELPVLNFEVGDNSICDGESTLISVSGANNYVWSPANGLDDVHGDSAIVAPTETTTYIVTGYDASQSCSVESAITIEVAESFDTDLFNFSQNDICPGEQVFIFSDLNYTYNWQENESLDASSAIVVATPMETTNYAVSISNDDCTIMDSVLVNVLDCDTIAATPDEIMVPNAFTPDDNGINDVWKIEGLELYSNNLVKVFNRWGELLFSQPNYNNDWDGTWDGNRLPDGTYYYIITLGNIEQPVTGTVTIYTGDE